MRLGAPSAAHLRHLREAEQARDRALSRAERAIDRGRCSEAFQHLLRASQANGEALSSWVSAGSSHRPAPSTGDLAKTHWEFQKSCKVARRNR